MDKPQTTFSTTQDKRRQLLVAGILIIILLGVAGISLRTQIAGLFGPRVPPPPCGQSSLQIGAAKFRIQNLNPASSSDLGVPLGKPGVAFWLQGGTGHYVFALSPSGDNASLDGQVKAGDPIKITWGDCSSDDYVVASTNKTVPEPAALMQETQPGITIFQPGAAGSDGWVMEGQRPEMLTPAAPETPNPNAVQAEISFISQTTSTDGKALSLKIAVKNTGSKVIHLSVGDISLTAAGAAPAAASSDPNLPLDIPPGASQTFLLTFAKPAGNTAVFKVLDFSVDLYF